MAYETYVPQRGPSGGKSTVRVLRNGDLSISPSVYDQYFNRANYVELMFDPNNKKVGLKPRSKPTKATYKLRESPQGGARRYVSAGQFLANYGVKVTKAKSYDVKWNEREKLVEFAAA
ncbi:MAG: hypothetical protein ABR527_07530 [Gemmatimonadota bacterium]|jgi:hypothetical protein